MIDVKIITQESFGKTLYAVIIADCSCITIPAAKARELISAGVPVQKTE